MATAQLSLPALIASVTTTIKTVTETFVLSRNGAVARSAEFQLSSAWTRPQSFRLKGANAGNGAF